MSQVRFYFSFRSPYSWLAFYRVSKLLDVLPVVFEFIPTYPSDDFINDPKRNIRKSIYIAEDIKRFADAYGLELNWPKPFDTEWPVPHAAWFYASEKGKCMEFALEAYNFRFSSGLDIANAEVLKDIAERCDLDANKFVNASQSVDYQNRFNEIRSQINKDKVFGVPFFIYEGQRFWGNDRIEWLIREIQRDNGMTIPELKQDLLHTPFLKI